MPESRLNENRQKMTATALNSGAEFFSLDWGLPVFFGVKELLPEFLALTTWPDLSFYNAIASRRLLARPDGVALTFIHQPKKPSRWRRRLAATSANDRYDQSVLGRGVIPTRMGSWHDLFNNISWLLFPEAKYALVERLGASYANRTPIDLERRQFRSREGDRLAILDEGGVIEASCGSRSQLMVFGHALHESFVLGREDIRCMKISVEVPVNAFDGSVPLIRAADDALAALLHSGLFSGEPLLPESVNLRDLL